MIYVSFVSRYKNELFLTRIVTGSQLLYITHLNSPSRSGLCNVTWGIHGLWSAFWITYINDYIRTALLEDFVDSVVEFPRRFCHLNQTINAAFYNLQLDRLNWSTLVAKLTVSSVDTVFAIFHTVTRQKLMAFSWEVLHHLSYNIIYLMISV